MLFAFTFFALFNGFASAAHGGDYWGKWYIVGVQAVVSLGLGLFAPFGVLVYWVFLRGSKQARPELDYLMGKASLDDIRRAYPLGLGYLIAPSIKRFKSRRQQEFTSGAILGAILAVPFIVIPTLFGA